MTITEGAQPRFGRYVSPRTVSCPAVGNSSFDDAGRIAERALIRNVDSRGAPSFLLPGNGPQPTPRRDGLRLSPFRDDDTETGERSHGEDRIRDRVRTPRVR